MSSSYRVYKGDWILIIRKVQGKTKLVDYPEVKEVADRLGASTAQVLVAWGVYRGYSVIPKSVQKGERAVAKLKLVCLLTDS